MIRATGFFLTSRFRCSLQALKLALLALVTLQAQGVGNSAGESIYLHGLLESGQPVSAARGSDQPIAGAEVACSNCHRRSGLGELEGGIRIPPISGAYLYHPRVKDRSQWDLPYVEGMRLDREPYTDATVARAIREGVAVDGRTLNYLMPRYALSDADLNALLGYLKALTPTSVPGVTGSVVNFATIVTPDADPVKRAAMLAVLDQYFAEQNAFASAEPPAAHPSGRNLSLAKRRWVLHVWQLKGPAADWDQQLRQYLLFEPVLAVISGIGGREWGPVHRFCESAALPCIFPNVQLPIVAEHDFYSLYFSKGVLLEAELLAHELTGADITPPRHVVQVFRKGDIGETAAKALHQALAAAGLRVVDRTLGATVGARQVTAQLREVDPGDVLVLWLRAPDIAALGDAPPPTSGIFISGLMGNLDAAPLPLAWRSGVRMTYPVDLPDSRRVRVDYARGWFALRHIPVTDEQLEVDTYVACSLTLETLTHIEGAVAADYFVERMEGMLEHQLVSGYYPRLTLAPNERFASKGAYLVHFANSRDLVAADTGWVVP